MGFLRLLLAFGVVRGHRAFFDYFFLMQGGVAVIFFYMISGFYMALVIERTYQPTGEGWEWRFLLQRAMRLFPAYWFVLFISVLYDWYVDASTPFTGSLGIGFLHQAAVAFSNLFLVGLDVQVSTLTLVYAGSPSFAFLWSYYPVFQAWTVAVEVTFYIFAAVFALRDRRAALVALGIGIYLRLYFVVANGKMIGWSRDGVGLSNTPWGYHFFGIALVYFMLGWVSYQIYKALDRRSRTSLRSTRYCQSVAAFVAVLFIGLAWRFHGYQRIADYNDYRVWLAIPVLACLIPLLFLTSRKSKVDNFVGQFSYPVYLCHVVAPDIATGIFHLSAGPWTTLASVLLLSTFIVFAVELPTDQLRHSLGRKMARGRVPAYHQSPAGSDPVSLPSS